MIIFQFWVTDTIILAPLKFQISSYLSMKGTEYYDQVVSFVLWILTDLSSDRVSVHFNFWKLVYILTMTILNFDIILNWQFNLECCVHGH